MNITISIQETCVFFSEGTKIIGMITIRTTARKIFIDFCNKNYVNKSFNTADELKIYFNSCNVQHFEIPESVYDHINSYMVMLKLTPKTCIVT